MKRSMLTMFAAIGLAASAHAAPAPTTGDWKLGVQAWTFRSGTFIEAVDKTAALGLKYIEAYPGQNVGGDIDGKMGPGLDDASRQKILAKLKSSGVKLMNFGVVGAKGEDEWRKLFQFAKAMGIETIVSEPEEDQFDILDKLTQEFAINLAIHDHPEPSRYWNPEKVLEVIKGRNPRIGACADTGHWSRSGLDTVACLQKLQGRIISLHFKDINKRAKDGHDLPWGTGVSTATRMLAELRRQNFKGVFSLEYEHDTPQLMDNARKCVEFFNRHAALSSADLDAAGMTKEISQVLARSTTAGRWPSPAFNLFRDDLSNATLEPDGWAWEDKALAAKGKGDIWTKEKYGDFILELDFKCATNTNSGVFLRCSDPVNWLHTGIEVQILDGDEADKKHICGAIFDCLAPTKNAVKKTGEWNHFKITAKANKIQVELNGEQVLDMDLNQWTDAHKNPDGTPNKFDTAYKNMARTGHIGLQYHGHPVWFRNLTVKPLDQ